MKVREVMARDVKTCRPEDSLESSAMLMWNNDCGALPVVDSSGKPIGIITDRDIAMYSVLNHKPLWELRASDVTGSRPLYSCKENDDISAALKAMQTHRVRRLPVISDSGSLRGIISIDDVVARSEERKSGISYLDTINTLKAVCVHH